MKITMSDNTAPLLVVKGEHVVGLVTEVDLTTLQYRAFDPRKPEAEQVSEDHADFILLGSVEPDKVIAFVENTRLPKAAKEAHKPEELKVRDMLDTKESRTLVAAKLSERLGTRVMIDKVANRIIVNEIVETAIVIGEVTEQELIGVDDPLALLADVAGEIVSIPPFVLVPKECILFHTEGVLPEGQHCTHILAGKGVASLTTFSSKETLNLRIARNELARLLQRKLLNPGVPARPTTLVSTSGVKEYQDPVSHWAQAWLNGAILEGICEWDENSKQLVKVNS